MELACNGMLQSAVRDEGQSPNPYCCPGNPLSQLQIEG